MLNLGTQQTLNRHQIYASSWFRFAGKPSNSGIPGGVELVSFRVRGKPFDDAHVIKMKENAPRT